MVAPMVPVRCLSVLILMPLGLGLGGCADWPDLPDPPVAEGAPAPRIAPLPGVLAAAPADTTALLEETATLQARAAALRARAAQVTVQP